jgi:hypothetical protein
MNLVACFVCSFNLQLRNRVLSLNISNLQHLSMDVEWSKEQMLDLIEQHEMRECLWNVMSKVYENHTECLNN